METQGKNNSMKKEDTMKSIKVNSDLIS